MTTAGTAIRSYRGQLTAIAVAAIGLFLFPGAAHAAQQDITMTPTSVSPIIQPGSIQHGSFQILNQGKTGYKFIVYASPYRVDNEDYTPDFTALPTAPNITSWFNFSTPGGSIDANKEVNISYTISIPEDTQPGGYYAAAFAETQYPKSADGITLNERVGEIFYIQVAGPVVKKGEIATWQSNFFQKPPLTSTIRLKNEGSIHYPADIHLYVKDILGHTKFSLYTQKELLPQTVRRVVIPWSKTPSIGLFKVSGAVTFLGQDHILGTKWVLVMSPRVRMVIITIIALSIVLIIGRGLYRSRKNKKKAKKI